MSRRLSKAYETQVDIAKQRAEALNESAQKLEETFAEFVEQDDPTMKDLCLFLGMALVQSNNLIVQSMSVTQAENDAIAIASAAGYFTDPIPPFRSVRTEASDDGARVKLLDEAHETLAYLRGGGHSAQASVVEQLIEAVQR